MPAIEADPAAARRFALQVVGRLREAGHEALWAGGCVRDELLGRTPADYDVATSATPETVRDLFGRRRTLAVGAAFGVITVIGPPGSGHVEVTTFRTDAAYTDGRHPAGVTFSTARDDAARRDFTINGLFFDPIAGVIHDYVGGQADLSEGIVRAIGVASLRFGEDHLRMLRAVRFAAGFGFVLEAETRAAIERMAHFVTTVSPERISAELRLMVSRPGRGQALELLHATGLARHVLPEVAPGAYASAEEVAAWGRAAAVVAALDEPCLPQALAVMAEMAIGPAGTASGPGRRPRDSLVERIASRLRLSNDELSATVFLRNATSSLASDAMSPIDRPWSQVQPWLADRHAVLLADLLRARADRGLGSSAVAHWVSERLAQPRGSLDPQPLLTGKDLMAAGVAKGRAVGEMLAAVRDRQLDGLLTSRGEALAWVRGQLANGPTA